MMKHNCINIHSHFVHHIGTEIISLDHNELVPENTFFSYGIHPAEAGIRVLDDALLEHPRCLAIGEAGLDKLAAASFAQQLQVFEMQVCKSEETGLPVVLHCVKAWNEVLGIRKKIAPAQPWIFHGFRKLSLLGSVLDENIMISIGTAVLFDKRLQEVVPEIPADRLFLETDSDEAHDIAEVYEKTAGLRQMDVDTLQSQIRENFMRTFKKASAD